MNKKLTADVLDDLNYQFVRRLQKEGLVTLKELFIDGTKIEANAYLPLAGKHQLPSGRVAGHGRFPV